MLRMCDLAHVPPLAIALPARAPPRATPFPYATLFRSVRDPLGGARRYRNDGGHFVDVSEQAGIFGSEIGFGLGVVVSDRSEEHTSELQSHSDLVCRLLLEKKKS